MHPTVKAARVAGALYLLLVVTSLFSFIYVPSLIVSGNAVATAQNILASETLFRISIVIELISSVVFILLVRALYRLLSDVNEGYASLMMTFALVSIPISFLNVVNELAALILLHGPSFLSVFDQGQMYAVAMLFLNLHSQVPAVNEIFFGLWLFPFGVLVYRSGLIPSILGILLIVNCFAYLAMSAISLVLPSYESIAFTVLLLPAALGELSMVAWLLIKGATVPSLATAAA